MVMFKNKFHINNRATGKMEACLPEEAALKDFVTFLETCRNRIRPAYDGIVLVAETEDSIPWLLKFVKRANLGAWFWRHVASFGAMSSYIQVSTKKNIHLLRSAWRAKGVGNIPLNALYREFFREKLKVKGILSDLKANYVYQVLLKVLGSPPDYANFFKVRN